MVTLGTKRVYATRGKNNYITLSIAEWALRINLLDGRELVFHWSPAAAAGL